MIDFRSDTVTKPTKGMLRAMMEAEVGDDVFQDDPTVNALEAKAAALFGMEAALFAPSGTMTNQIAIKVHTSPGDEVICDQLSHIYHYEGGGIAFNSGCSVKLINGDQGRFTAKMVEQEINPDDVHFPRTSLVSVENTCNKGGGVVWDPVQLSELSAYCRSRQLAIHMDGARIFNAMAVTRQSSLELGEQFDSISICLSKGLGCPVGSLLLGRHDFIRQARRVRKVFGGGMRQAGILAAAGIYALDHHVGRLTDDHRRAHTLEAALSGLPWVSRVLPVETNIVVVELNQNVEQIALLERMKKFGILAVSFGKGKIRLVTHLDIDDGKVSKAIEVFQQLK